MIAPAQARAVNGQIAKYLTLIEKSARDAREALCEAEEMTIEAAKPIVEVAASLGQEGGPSINARLAAAARQRTAVYQERVKNLSLAMDRLVAIIGTE